MPRWKSIRRGGPPGSTRIVPKIMSRGVRPTTTLRHRLSCHAFPVVSARWARHATARRMVWGTGRTPCGVRPYTWHRRMNGQLEHVGIVQKRTPGVSARSGSLCGTSAHALPRSVRPNRPMEFGIAHGRGHRADTLRGPPLQRRWIVGRRMAGLDMTPRMGRGAGRTPCRLGGHPVVGADTLRGPPLRRLGAWGAWRVWM